MNLANISCLLSLQVPFFVFGGVAAAAETRAKDSCDKLLVGRLALAPRFDQIVNSSINGVEVPERALLELHYRLPAEITDSNARVLIAETAFLSGLPVDVVSKRMIGLRPTGWGRSVDLIYAQTAILSGRTDEEIREYFATAKRSPFGRLVEVIYAQTELFTGKTHEEVLAFVNSGGLPAVENEAQRVIYYQTALLTGLHVRAVYDFFNHFHDSERTKFQDMILGRAALLNSHRVIKTTGHIIRR